MIIFPIVLAASKNTTLKVVKSDSKIIILLLSVSITDTHCMYQNPRFCSHVIHIKNYKLVEMTCCFTLENFRTIDIRKQNKNKNFNVIIRKNILLHKRKLLIDNYYIIRKWRHQSNNKGDVLPYPSLYALWPNCWSFTPMYHLKTWHLLWIILDKNTFFLGKKIHTSDTSFKCKHWICSLESVIVFRSQSYKRKFVFKTTEFALNHW